MSNYLSTTNTILSITSTTVDTIIYILLVCTCPYPTISVGDLILLAYSDYIS